MKDKAQEIRMRLRFLFAVGDAAVFYRCWKDEDHNLIDEYSWVLDVNLPDGWQRTAEGVL